MTWLHSGLILGFTWAAALYAYLVGYGQGWAAARTPLAPQDCTRADDHQYPCNGYPRPICLGKLEITRPWREAVVEDFMPDVIPPGNTRVTSWPRADEPATGREDY